MIESMGARNIGKPYSPSLLEIECEKKNPPRGGTKKKRKRKRKNGPRGIKTYPNNYRRN